LVQRVVMLRLLTVTQKPSAARDGKAHTSWSQAPGRAKPQWHPYGT
jgi:hypothetical protein